MDRGLDALHLLRRPGPCDGQALAVARLMAAGVLRRASGGQTGDFFSIEVIICGWKKLLNHQLIGGKHPIVYRVSTCFNMFQPVGGAGFIPSTV